MRQTLVKTSPPAPKSREGGDARHALLIEKREKGCGSPGPSGKKSVPFAKEREEKRRGVRGQGRCRSKEKKKKHKATWRR